MQLLFPFPSQADVSAHSYVPLASHAAALAGLQRLGTMHGFRGLRLVGQAGCGKTHLLHAWAAATGAMVWEAAGLPFLPPAGSTVVVDDVDTLDAIGQENVFHIYNSLYKSGGALVVASAVSITPHMPLLADLRSRLLTLPEVELGQSTEADLTQLLLKWATDCQLTLKPDVVKYVLARAERNPAMLHALVRQLDTLSLVEKRGVTLPLVRKVLEDVAQGTLQG
ncbi:MAG: DnaA/Hda family protein [Alphaproteobacteria bacterium]